MSGGSGDLWVQNCPGMRSSVLAGPPLAMGQALWSARQQREDLQTLILQLTGGGGRQPASNGGQDGEPGQGSQREPAAQHGEGSGTRCGGSVLKEASEGCEQGRG